MYIFYSNLELLARNAIKFTKGKIETGSTPSIYAVKASALTKVKGVSASLRNFNEPVTFISILTARGCW